MLTEQFYFTVWCSLNSYNKIFPLCHILFYYFFAKNIFLLVLYDMAEIWRKLIMAVENVHIINEIERIIKDYKKRNRT